ncbi:uncharacterized protein LTHEOB_5773 [Lasiodiplodia theobromae]|uniref:F-box domain-containing protein n=1 Tax=Lasiodiplodia theobromae TaxID=45133 RepID=A0A5N5DKN8_9PEZI|nr:uncharacterized protein LTHEOB_5773 [Lasiodiplodia theobromae]KAB2578317.1 hypothetical protein DBV05_g3055 [Lasiodiplodia theobromae]KAF4544764.1 hypothetical protein LTHEOB_5773 [Lasiodiplodia theobromae]
MASDSDGLTVGPTAAMGLGHAPRASLMGMPTELLLQIAEAVTDKKGIMSLCRTSRRLSSAAQPELFKRFPIHIQRQAYYTSFLKTITMRPSLGAHVKELHFWLFKRQDPNPGCFDCDEGDIICGMTYWYHPSPPRVDIARATALAAEVGDIESELHAGLEDNDGEAILISLLRHLPKLQVLSVWLDGFNPGSAPEPRLLANFFLSLAAANQDPSKPLVNLKRVTFATPDYYKPTWDHLWNALARLRMSNLLWKAQKRLRVMAFVSISDPKERARMYKYGRYSQQATRMSYAYLLDYARRC